MSILFSSTSTGMYKTGKKNKFGLIDLYYGSFIIFDYSFTPKEKTMKKFQENVQSLGVILMLVFPICIFLTILCSDYRTEEGYNQYEVISSFLVNWYTFITLPIGMLFYSVGWFKVPQRRKRPTTF